MLDVNTDCAVCTFPYNKLPFEVDENKVVQGYYYDMDKTAPKYRMAEEPKRNEIARLPKYTRTDVDTLKKPKWKVHQDVEDNDMAPLVKTILESNKSWNINGRAGTGKSHLVRMLQDELDKKEIKYKSLAPTNKSAIVINGMTMHKFKAEFKLSSFLHERYKIHLHR